MKQHQTGTKQLRRAVILAGSALFLFQSVFAQTSVDFTLSAPDSSGFMGSADDLPLLSTTAGTKFPLRDMNRRSWREYQQGTGTAVSSRFIHKIGAEVRPAYIIPTHAFLRGENYTWNPIDFALSGHLKYAFQFHPGTYRDNLYGSVYQGAGVAYMDLGDSEQLGQPFLVYLLQGARIAQLSPRLSLNYEWNFGLSFGWKPYDRLYNEFNRVIGSRVNAYINADFYLNYMLSRRIDLTLGATLTHFSNGSTKLPNGGLNTIGGTLGVVYNVNREHSTYRQPAPLPGRKFERHMSYDLVLFGAWRQKSVQVRDEYIASDQAYTVMGFNFSPMYNLGYKIRLGGSLDGVYDRSANIYMAEDHMSGTQYNFSKPSLGRQLSLGVSARAEYVMPYFTVAFGFGANVLHGGGELKSFYQILALKIDVTRDTFLHIGYSLKELKAPNFLMLGIGYRFNNRSQTYRP